jgi:hypothetical protein
MTVTTREVAPVTTERLHRALEFVREHVTDDNRRVQDPEHTFENADGTLRKYIDIDLNGYVCRACLAGWAWIADVRHGWDRYDTVGLIVERACEQLGVEEDVDHVRETRATREGPGTLNAVIDRAHMLADDPGEIADIAAGRYQ